MKLVLFFLHAGPRDRTQILRLTARAFNQEAIPPVFILGHNLAKVSILALNLGSSCPYLLNSWAIRPSRQLVSVSGFAVQPWGDFTDLAWSTELGFLMEDLLERF